MNKYDIYLARLSFTDSNGDVDEEVSPVLILNPSMILVLSVKCTSHWVRKCNMYDYEIQKWAEAGLHKDTTIMFDYPLKLRRENILRKIGHLDSFDIRYVDSVVNRIIEENL